MMTNKLKWECVTYDDEGKPQLCKKEPQKCLICKKNEAMNYTIRDFDCPVCEWCMKEYRKLIK